MCPWHGEGIYRPYREAHQLFQQAWELVTNDFEAFTAAHYLARNQQDPGDKLSWNLKALNLALSISGDTMKTHYASLYLNVAKSYEDGGNEVMANQYYQLASSNSIYLQEGPYGDMIRTGIGEGLRRTRENDVRHPGLTLLITSWCERRELKPLSFVLPVWVGYSGTQHDKDKLVRALSLLGATRCLNVTDQDSVNKFIEELSQLRSVAKGE